jgi:hypothetical protein
MRSMLSVLAIIGICLSTVACATTGAPAADPSLGDALAKLSATTVIDLDAADAIAVAKGDVVAHACYPVLKTWFVAQLGTATPTLGQVKGVFSAFELARTTRMGVESGVNTGIPVTVKLGCAALLQDERLFALRLAAMIGGASVGVPGVSTLIPK